MSPESQKTNRTMKTDNELIAEFMGGVKKMVPEAFGQDGFIVYDFKQRNNPNPHADIGTEKRIEQLDYHKRWDWLMPVIERIESTSGASVEIRQGYCGIIHHSSKQWQTSHMGSKHDSTYK